MGFSFENLEIYKQSIELVGKINRVVKTFPKDELFILTQQLKRASLSIPTNIAEGSNRSVKHFSSYLDIARGSLLECVALLEVALKEAYLNQDEYEELYQDYELLSKKISALKRSINTK